jgi:hypothetical protein
MILDITGSLEVTIYDKDGVEVSKQKEQDIIKALNKGDLYFSLKGEAIMNTNFEYLYSVEIDIMDSTEYNFE